MAKKKKAASKKKASKSKAPKKKAKAAKKPAKKTTKKKAKPAAKKKAKPAAKKKAKPEAKKKAKPAAKKKAKPVAKKKAAKAAKPVAKKAAKKKAKKKAAEPKHPVRKIKPKELAKRPKRSNRKRIFPIVEEVEPQDDSTKKKKKLKKLPAAELRKYKNLLHKLRDQAVDGISFLAGDNLSRSQRDSSGDRSSSSFHMADQGTDNFDREFALNLVSGEQELLYEIDDALQRIVERTYGYCQECEELIEKNRLEALPHARMCIKCKERLERGKTRYRPFGPTLSHSG